MECFHLDEVSTSSQQHSGKTGAPCVDANSLHAGTDHTHVNHLLSTLNVPTMSHKVYKVREREVGHSVESVAKESCKNVNCVENI